MRGASSCEGARAVGGRVSGSTVRVVGQDALRSDLSSSSDDGWWGGGGSVDPGHHGESPARAPPDKSSATSDIGILALSLTSARGGSPRIPTPARPLDPPAQQYSTCSDRRRALVDAGPAAAARLRPDSCTTQPRPRATRQFIRLPGSPLLSAAPRMTALRRRLTSLAPLSSRPASRAPFPLPAVELDHPGPASRSLFSFVLSTCLGSALPPRRLPRSGHPTKGLARLARSLAVAARSATFCSPPSPSSRAVLDHWTLACCAATFKGLTRQSLHELVPVLPHPGPRLSLSLALVAHLAPTLLL